MSQDFSWAEFARQYEELYKEPDRRIKGVYNQMKIIDRLNEDRINISFEVFPPKTDAGFANVQRATDEIAKLDPSYISVTYGAGGGTSKNTAKIASHIKDDLHVLSLAHLTCASSTKEEVREVIRNLKELGIENILALRGDIPEGMKFPDETVSIMHMSWWRRSENREISVLVQRAIRKVMWRMSIRKMISAF